MNLTRAKANEMLFLWKVGAELFPPHVIAQCLYATGDLDGPSTEAEPRLVRVPSLPAGVERALMARSKRPRKRAPSVLLEAAGTAGPSDAKEAR
jgi:hypothetical protein